MSEVSPVAEAVMRLTAFSRFADNPIAREEIRMQQALLQATASENHVLRAAQFVHRLALQLQRVGALLA